MIAEITFASAHDSVMDRPLTGLSRPRDDASKSRSWCSSRSTMTASPANEFPAIRRWCWCRSAGSIRRSFRWRASNRQVRCSNEVPHRMSATGRPQDENASIGPGTDSSRNRDRTRRTGANPHPLALRKKRSILHSGGPAVGESPKRSGFEPGSHPLTPERHRPQKNRRKHLRIDDLMRSSNLVHPQEPHGSIILTEPIRSTFR